LTLHPMQQTHIKGELASAETLEETCRIIWVG